MDATTERTIDELARRQAGHLTRAQLHAAGFSRPTVHRRIVQGRLVVAGARTLRLASVPRTGQGDVVASCIDTGGVASHRTAAWLHGLGDRPPWVDISVAKGRPDRRSRPTAERPAIRFYSSTNLPADDVLHLGAIPVTSVARTALGLGALVVDGALSPAVLTKFVDRAVDGDLVSDPWLWWLLAQRRCRGRNGVSALEEVLAHRARLGPTGSWLEREVLRILEEAGLPLPRTQCVVRRSGRFAARVDFLYELGCIVLEALGYAFHRTPEQIEADTRRANTLQLLGFRVYQFTTNQIVRSPDSLVATVSEARERARHERRSPAGLVLPG
ncbi:hypothetical protein BH23ACT2_BH23ACT2_07460 [soil metagenome]